MNVSFKKKDVTLLPMTLSYIIKFFIYYIDRYIIIALYYDNTRYLCIEIDVTISVKKQ